MAKSDVIGVPNAGKVDFRSTLGGVYKMGCAIINFGFGQLEDQSYQISPQDRPLAKSGEFGSPRGGQKWRFGGP